VFDAKQKSFLVPVLSSDWQALSRDGHLSWCLWNSHTLRHDRMSPDCDIDCYMSCSSYDYTVDQVFAAADVALPPHDVMNIHEVGVAVDQLDEIVALFCK